LCACPQKKKKLHRKKQKPAAQIAHMFFANAEIPILKKNKRAIFSNAYQEKF